MKNKLSISSLALAILFSSSVIAGTLMSQWTEGTSRYCKYSDGEVVEISFGSTCSASN